MSVKHFGNSKVLHTLVIIIMTIIIIPSSTPAHSSQTHRERKVTLQLIHT